MPRLCPVLTAAVLLTYSGAAYTAPAAHRPSGAKAGRLARSESARYGVYLLQSRIGSMQTKSYPVRFEGKRAVRMDATTDVKVTALGGTVEQSMSLSEWLDAQGHPLFSKVEMTSLGRTTRIDARYFPRQVVCSLDAGGQKSSKTVPIPAGVSLASDPTVTGTTGNAAPKVGKKETLYFFEPVTLTIQKVQLEVVKTEKRSVGGKQVQAFLIRSRNSYTGGSQTWVDGRGELLEDNNPIGIRLVREDVDAGATAAYVPPKDFAVETSVRTAVSLPEPRKTGYLKLKVSGIPDETLILSDARQRVLNREKVGETWSATYEIQSRELPQQSLPLAAPGATGDGLGDAPYLGTTNASIRKVARELAEGAPDRAAVARRVRAWVKGHMEKPTNVGTPRSAVEILSSKDGVCRDYATLYAAIARAAGVPTRICSGMVFFGEGFFYHAWVEAKLTDGVDGWYAFDPTLNDDFVDATHVKFAQGDPLQMYTAVRVVGHIQAVIQEFH